MSDTVDVVVPVRNEAAHLDAALERIVAQGPVVRRIVVAVAPSSDGTEDIVAEWTRRDPRVVGVPNPGMTAPTGLNAALAQSDAAYVARVDGHCLVPPDYAATLLKTALDTQAALVGPAFRSTGRTPVQAAVARAMNSRLGGGAAAYRSSATAGPVDTVACGLYDRGWLDRVGGFDERLTRNQDDELHSRIRRAGGTVWLQPDVVVEYLPRAGYGALWRQYHDYGYWRVLSTRAGQPLRARHAVAPLLVAGVLASAAAPRRGPRTALGLAAYAAAVTAGVRKEGDSPAFAAQAAAAAVVMHAAYGAGFWHALLTRRGGP